MSENWAAAPRYALYFTPAQGSPLATFGAQWLGRDVGDGRIVEQPMVAGFTPEELAALTADPRRYGFHATLKAPFRLAPGRSLGDLLERLSIFSGMHRAFRAPPLQLASIGGFRALVLSDRCPEMDDLAAACVTGFEPFRAELSENEIARREAAGLDDEERQNLLTLGYPYVLDRFRFHMTLTRRVDDALGARVDAALAPLVAPHCAEPLTVDAVTLCAQAGPDQPFVQYARCGLGQG